MAKMPLKASVHPAYDPFCAGLRKARPSFRGGGKVIPTRYTYTSTRPGNLYTLEMRRFSAPNESNKPRDDRADVRQSPRA